MNDACRSGFHWYELVLPLHSEAYAICRGCDRRATPEDAARRNKATTERWKKGHR